MLHRYLSLALFFLCLAASQHSLAKPEGKALYDQYCASCHNTNQAGGIGVALLPNKLALLSDSYINQSTKLGRPGRLMPSYKETLSTSQIQAITDYLRQTSNKEAPAILDHKLIGNQERGQALYQQHCAECHDNNGRGGGLGTGLQLSRSKAFPVMPISLSNEGFQDAILDTELQHIISAKYHSPSSDSCNQVNIEPDQAADLVAYIRTLRSAAKINQSLLHESPVFIVDSPYDLATTVSNIREAVAANNYRVFPSRYLEQGLVDETKIDQNQVLIRFCNFSDFYELLKVDPRVGLALPCTITAIKTDTGVKLIAPNPAQLAPMFNNDELIQFSERIGETILSVLEEATF